MKIDEYKNGKHCKSKELSYHYSVILWIELNKQIYSDDVQKLQVYCLIIAYYFWM